MAEQTTINQIQSCTGPIVCCVRIATGGMLDKNCNITQAFYNLKANSRLAGAFLHNAQPDAHALALNGFEKFGARVLPTRSSMASAPAAM